MFGVLAAVAAAVAVAAVAVAVGAFGNDGFAAVAVAAVAVSNVHSALLVMDSIFSFPTSCCYDSWRRTSYDNLSFLSATASVDNSICSKFPLTAIL